MRNFIELSCSSFIFLASGSSVLISVFNCTDFCDLSLSLSLCLSFAASVLRNVLTCSLVSAVNIGSFLYTGFKAVAVTPMIFSLPILNLFSNDSRMIFWHFFTEFGITTSLFVTSLR